MDCCEASLQTAHHSRDARHCKVRNTNNAAGSMQPMRRSAVSFFARVSLRRVSAPAMLQVRATSFAGEGATWSSSESVGSTPATPFSPTGRATPSALCLSPPTPDGFYGFGDEGGTGEEQAPFSATPTPRQADEPMPRAEGSDALVMGDLVQSSLFRRREGMRQSRPSSCPVGEGALQLGSVSSSRIFRRRQANSLQRRPRTADALDAEDCAFGFDHEFIFRGSRWRGVSTPLSPETGAVANA